MGPFHAGTNQNVSCLATLTGQTLAGGSIVNSSGGGGSSGGVSAAALGGGIAGAFVVGALLAALAMFLLGKKKKAVGRRGSLYTVSVHDQCIADDLQNVARNGSTESLEGYANPRPATWRQNTQASTAKVSPYADINSPSSDPQSLGYHYPTSTSPTHTSYPTNNNLQAGSLSALNANTDNQDRAYRNTMGLGDFHPQQNQSFGQGGSSGGAVSDAGSAGGSGAAMVNPHPISPVRPQVQAGPSSSGSVPRKSVYVVHSDGGNNVHITLPEGGADVVELPPNYNPGVHAPGGGPGEKSPRPTQ